MNCWNTDERGKFLMTSRYFVPVVGQIYRNRNGNQYLCLAVAPHSLPQDTTASFQRISDGWTLVAHGVQVYERDGTIEWNYSTGGHWPKK